MQKRFRNFEHPLQSFDHNIFNLGLHHPGRYVGFDMIIPVDTALRNFKIGHTEGNYTYRDLEFNEVGPIGVAITKQGAIIMEDAPIGPFSIESNAGNTTPRYDILYMMHNQVEISGGQDATYGIQKGPTGYFGPTPPLGSPMNKIALGVIKIEAGGTTLDDCTFIKEKCPDGGDGDDARISEVNLFQKFQGWGNLTPLTSAGRVLDATTPLGVLTKHLWTFPDSSNTFGISSGSEVSVDGFRIEGLAPSSTGLRSGLRVNLVLSDGAHITDDIPYFTPLLKSQGYLPIKFTERYATKSDVVPPTMFPPAPGYPIREIRAPVGETIIVELLSLPEEWRVINIGGNWFPRGRTHPYLQGSYDIGALPANTTKRCPITFPTPLPYPNYTVLATLRYMISEEVVFGTDQPEAMFVIEESKRTVNGFSIIVRRPGITPSSNAGTYFLDYLILLTPPY